MIKVGLLPLYIELYDAVVPEARPRLEAFYENIARKLEQEGFLVLRAPFCRLKEEFRAAVAGFEEAGASCIVTLHMAYSPSLESAESLCGTALPVIVLDTTDTFDFGPDQSPDHILYCHGIHGVMDLCSLMKQKGKAFAIAAGHSESSDAVSRVCGYIRAAHSAEKLSGSKTGVVGGAFDGMGDFAVTAGEMETRFGVRIVTAEPARFKALGTQVKAAEIAEEMQRDFEKYAPLGEIPESAHALGTRDGLTLRAWAQEENLQALSVNFLRVSQAGFGTMPFMELCKFMARGVGYAGEGDVLTASFTGALMQGYPDVSFIEIFCPDWKGNTLFLSHMGEMNIRLAGRKPEMAEKEFIYGDGHNPIACYGCYRGGPAVFVNIFRTEDDFALLAAPVEMLSPAQDAFAGNIRGWMKPPVPVAEFLEKISAAGATHHSILVYGAKPEEIRFFGRLLGLKVTVL